MSIVRQAVQILNYFIAGQTVQSGSGSDLESMNQQSTMNEGNVHTVQL
jgi:hypothetical protein